VSTSWKERKLRGREHGHVAEEEPVKNRLANVQAKHKSYDRGGKGEIFGSSPISRNRKRGIKEKKKMKGWRDGRRNIGKKKKQGAIGKKSGNRVRAGGRKEKREGKHRQRMEKEERETEGTIRPKLLYENKDQNRRSFRPTDHCAHEKGDTGRRQGAQDSEGRNGEKRRGPGKMKSEGVL